MILQEILANKWREVSEREARLPLEEVKRQAAAAPATRAPAFDGAISLIAEVKRRSPSRGWIHPPGRGDFAATLDPVAQARAYEQGGAAAISVLTDERFFGGSFEDLEAVRGAVRIPILCKDFILTPYQVYEARARGADLILLIVAALGDEALIALQDLARQLGMTPLVEVHDQHELARAVAAGAELIGINNRDLTDFSIDLRTTESLAPLVPDGAIVGSESGLATRQDVERVRRAGARVVLVGETLMRSGDPAATIRELLG
jgi:indole-3-glycerol phosphate synthase